MYSKNWVGQVRFENFDFLVNICTKVNFFFFWKLDVCTISELRMKKRVSKSECTRKIEWDRSVLKILSFWSRSKVCLVQAFSLSFFFFFGGSDPGQTVGPGQTGSDRSGWWRHGWRHCFGRVWHVWMTSSMTSQCWTCGTCDFWRILIGAWDLKAAPPNIFAARGGACLGFWALNFWGLSTQGRSRPLYGQFCKITGRFPQIWRFRPRVVANLWPFVAVRGGGRRRFWAWIFLGFVDREPMDLVVVSVFWIGVLVCTDLKD